ncbi:MAG: DUF169 domain-containing protein [Thermoleophilia bacterium]|nr:DUF169 domain-containing protein [Thermoleophilia bacterium]
MPESGETGLVKEAVAELGRHVGFLLSPTALHFAAAPPEGAMTPPAGAWACIFSFMDGVQEGSPASFSRAAPGCAGAVCYFGFENLPVVPAAIYLAGRERLKKDAGLAAAFYRDVQPAPARDSHLVFRRLDTTPDTARIEVVNLWVEALSLSALHALANYDRAGNDNVIIPFSSGCQSIWTLPFKEKSNGNPRAVAGSLDPTVRRYLPDGAISFSLPAGRLVEMCENIPGSFMSR